MTVIHFHCRLLRRKPKSFPGSRPSKPQKWDPGQLDLYLEPPCCFLPGRCLLRGNNPVRPTQSPCNHSRASLP